MTDDELRYRLVWPNNVRPTVARFPGGLREIRARFMGHQYSLRFHVESGGEEAAIAAWNAWATQKVACQSAPAEPMRVEVRQIRRRKSTLTGKKPME